MFNCKRYFSACLASGVVLLSSAAFAADDTNARLGPGKPDAGKSKGAMCFGCHGIDGNSRSPQFPKLAGQYGVYITKQMHNYQTGIRNHPMMNSMAASLTGKDLDDVSAYFASQPLMQGEKPSSNEVGKKLFEEGDLSRMMVSCASCHGATGKGLNDENPVYPVIGGQHKAYLLAQLQDFRTDNRHNSPGGVMNVTVHKLTDAELEALAEYISGL